MSLLGRAVRSLLLAPIPSTLTSEWPAFLLWSCKTDWKHLLCFSLTPKNILCPPPHSYHCHNLSWKIFFCQFFWMEIQVKVTSKAIYSIFTAISLASPSGFLLRLSAISWSAEGQDICTLPLTLAGLALSSSSLLPLYNCTTSSLLVFPSDSLTSPVSEVNSSEGG